MRWAVPAALFLLVSLAAPIQAAPRASRVAGDYAYDYAGHLARVQVAGRDGDRLSGRVSYTSEFATFAGPVTCVTVDGADAWLSGPITSGSSGFEGLDGWAARIHDAGSPGWIGDSAITFVDTVVGVHELCAAGTSDYDSYLVRIVEGNVVVHPAR
jgi:hypothetical protein